MPERLKRKIAVSSDIAGAGQNLNRLREVYHPVSDQIDGLEIIAVGPGILFQRRLQQTEELGLSVLDIHGRTRSNGSSGWDRTRNRWLFDNSIISTSKLLRKYANEYSILFHAPEAKKHFEKIVQSNSKFIWIENDHPQLEAVDDAVNLVGQLRSRGVNCGLMFDFAHAVGAKPLREKSFFGEFDAMIFYMNERLSGNEVNGTPVWQGIHLPIGVNHADSLPIINKNLMSDKILNQMADSIPESIKLIVIEYQAGVLGVGKEDMSDTQRRIGNTFERLDQHSILNSN